MGMNRKILILGFIITLLIFSLIIILTNYISDRREEVVINKMNDVVKEYEDMQTISFMSDLLGDEVTCPALKARLSSMNKGIWDLGGKIDSYREATEQFITDPFYMEQKKEFNRKEVLYFLMLKKMKETCGINQTIVSFFYQKKDECQDCDAQSFVLIDLKKELEDLKKGDELAMFSFDVDSNLTTVNLLTNYYNISSYPCTIIENDVYCGLHNKDEMKSFLCKRSNLSICGN